MEAKELQIGDWYVNSDGDKCRVIKNFGNEVWGEGDNVSDATDNPQPIPLTPEILEKNGFELRYDPKGLYSYKRIFRLWYNENVKEIYLNIGLEPVVMDSVHKMQHALRLFGLTDLADSFII